MLPNDFIAVYGQCIPHTSTVGMGATLVIEQSPHRSLLGFLSASSNFEVMIGEDDGQTLNGRFFGQQSEPFIFTHPLHGPIVNAKWTLRPNLGGGTIRWVEAFMRPLVAGLNPIANPPITVIKTPRSPVGEIPQRPTVDNEGRTIEWLDREPSPAEWAAYLRRGINPRFSEGYQQWYLEYPAVYPQEYLP